MTLPETWFIALLAAAVLVGTVRLARRRTDGEIGNAAFAAHLALQPLLAIALYVTLFPPPQPAAPTSSGLTVLTAGWSRALDAAGRAALDPARTVRLPEAEPAPHIDVVPDLGSALRRDGDSTRLHIVGDGLHARDRDIARGRVQTFTPSPPVAGLLQLEVPTEVAPGASVVVRGRAHGLDGAEVRLADTAGNPTATAAVTADGTFALGFTAPGPGRVDATLELARDELVYSRVPLSLDVAAADAPRVLLLAAAPGPELKYLRRWAADAGLVLDSRVMLAPRVPQQRGQAQLDAATLQRIDALIIDDRSWHGLSKSERERVLAAVDAGLGLLLRVTADPERDDAFAALGFQVAVTDQPRALRLVDAYGRDDTGPWLSRRALAVDAADSALLLADHAGHALARWRPHGRGRVALWWLGDSFRLVLGGHAAMHGQIWSEAVATLARAGATPRPSLDRSRPQTHERVVICALDGAAQVVAPDDTSTRLQVDERGCAGFWPTGTGEHRLLGDAIAERRFVVYADDPAAPLAAARRRDATEALLTDPLIRASAASPPRAGSPWPGFVTFLVLFATLLALERRPRAAARA